MTSINVMQDQITRARLAGEPPHVMLVPRLRHIGLMEFNRADETIAEGHAVVDHALPLLRRYVDAHAPPAKHAIVGGPWRVLVALLAVLPHSVTVGPMPV